MIAATVEDAVADKPSYLGLLNAIALGEGRAHRFLRAWAERTDDPDVRRVLLTVAIREGEHALAFEKRLCELGYDLREKADPSAENALAIAESSRSDLEKFEALGLARDAAAEDPFAHMLDDTTIDPKTGELLGRYIAEERDSGRLLRGCYRTLAARGQEQRGAEVARELRELRASAESVSSALDDVQREVARLRN